jgi:hypothetical protein
MNEAEPGASLSWPPGFAGDGYPHLGRVLGREAVEAKRSQKAENPSGDAATGFRQTVPLSQDRAREGVEAPSDAFDDPSFAQPPQLRARHSPMLELASACDPDLSQELDCTIVGGQLRHNTSVIANKYRDFVTRSGDRCQSVRRRLLWKTEILRFAQVLGGAIGEIALDDGEEVGDFLRARSVGHQPAVLRPIA